MRPFLFLSPQTQTPEMGVDNLYPHCAYRGFSLETTPPFVVSLISKALSAEWRLLSRVVGRTNVYLVVPECVAVIHLQSLWRPETEDTQGEATSQSY